MTHEEKLRFILNHYGLRKQMTKLFEELGEVSIEISRFMLGRGSKFNIGAEIADVLVMLRQIAIALDLEEYINKQIEFKLDRQIDRINGEGKDEH